MKVRNPVLARLLEQRQTQVDVIQHILEAVESDGDRDLVDAERSNVEAARTRIEQLDAQITPLQAFEDLRDAHDQSVSNLRPTISTPDSQPTPLGGIKPREQKYPTRGDFVVDMIRAQGMDQAPDRDARQRVEAALGRPFPEARATSVTGDLESLLPEPIVGEVLSDLDAERPVVASFGAKPMSAADIPGKRFRRPFIKQHTLAGEQSAEGATLASRKLLTDEVDFAKKTVGGWLQVTRQTIDWTSPSAWNMLLADLEDAYSIATEQFTAEEFLEPIEQTVWIPTADKAKMQSWVDALYAAAVMAATADGTKRATAKRLANCVWTSVDMWGSLGAILTAAKIQATNKPGTASVKAFAGDILDLERVVAPDAPPGTFVVGNRSRFEVYEARVGLLQAVVPSTAGIDVAHVGYVAAGHMDDTAFAKVAIGTAPVGP